jgi:hypothetical protein
MDVSGELYSATDLAPEMRSRFPLPEKLSSFRNRCRQGGEESQLREIQNKINAFHSRVQTHRELAPII